MLLLAVRGPCDVWTHVKASRWVFLLKLGVHEGAATTSISGVPYRRGGGCFDTGCRLHRSPCLLRRRFPPYRRLPALVDGAKGIRRWLSCCRHILFNLDSVSIGSTGFRRI